MSFDGMLVVSRIDDPTQLCGYRLHVDHEDPRILIANDVAWELRMLDESYPARIVPTDRGPVLRIKADNTVAVYLIGRYRSQINAWEAEWID